MVFLMLGFRVVRDPTRTTLNPSVRTVPPQPPRPREVQGEGEPEVTRDPREQTNTNLKRFVFGTKEEINYVVAGLWFIQGMVFMVFMIFMVFIGFMMQIASDSSN